MSDNSRVVPFTYIIRIHITYFTCTLFPRLTFWTLTQCHHCWTAWTTPLGPASKGRTAMGTGGYHKTPDTATGIRWRTVKFYARWSWYAVPYDCEDYKQPTIQRERTTQCNNIVIETFFSRHLPSGSSAMSTGRLVAEKLRTYFSVAVSGCHRLHIVFETLLLCLRRVLSDPP